MAPAFPRRRVLILREICQYFPHDACELAGRIIQPILDDTPIRQKLVHEMIEAWRMVTFQQVNHLVYQHVLETFYWFFCKFQVKPDTAPRDMTCTPTRSHLSDTAFRNALAYQRFPFCYQTGQVKLHLVTIPAIQQFLSHGYRRIMFDTDFQHTALIQHNFLSTLTMHDLQRVSFSKHGMHFVRYKIQYWRGRHQQKIALPFLYPVQPGQNDIANMCI